MWRFLQPNPDNKDFINKTRQICCRSVSESCRRSDDVSIWVPTPQSWLRHFPETLELVKVSTTHQEWISWLLRCSDLMKSFFFSTKKLLGSIPGGICMFSLCLHGFFPGSSSHTPTVPCVSVAHMDCLHSVWPRNSLLSVKLEYFCFQIHSSFIPILKDIHFISIKNKLHLSQTFHEKMQTVWATV